jgi:TolB-like protein/Tfp pilus assembly protein PilF
MSLYHELKRRNVFRVGIAYLAGSWLLIEVSETIFPLFGFDDTPARIMVIVLAIGFPLFLLFSWVFEITPEGLKKEKDIDRAASVTHKTGKLLDRFIIVLLALALGYFAFDKFVLDPVEDAELVEETAQQVRSDVLVESYGDKSIAVLPFINMSDDAGNEYFSDGISEELLNLLAKIPELRVISRSSAFYFKGKDVKLADVARELNVAHILEGSVRKAGNQVRITAQLIEASSDTHLWSATYDRTLDDIFVIQDEIAGSVVDALKLTLFGDVPRAEPIDPEAYALYLQAVHVGNRYTAEALEQSNAMLKQVLALDPNYARAWRVLARNYSVQAVRGLLPRDEGNALAREAITQALVIDPNLAEAHSWFGMFVARQDDDLVAAAWHLQYALSLEPNNLLVLSHSSGFSKTLGRLDETIAIQEYQVAHDPLNPLARSNLGWNYLFAGRPDEAIAAARTLMMLSPGSVWVHSLLGLALLHKGENEAALKAVQQEPDEATHLWCLVMVYHAAAQAAESDAALTELIEKYERTWPYYIAALLAYRGEVDRTFAWLEKAVAYGDPILSSIAVDTWFSSLYEDPRWLPFLESIGRSPSQLDAIEFQVKLPE